MGLQTDPTFLRLYNADQAADYCLRNAAYLARKVAGPMDQTAAAITAQCANLIGMYQASKHGPKWSAEQIADDDEEDNKERAPKALAMVLDYRTGASGVASPNVDSFAKPAEQP